MSDAKTTEPLDENVTDLQPSAESHGGAEPESSDIPTDDAQEGAEADPAAAPAPPATLPVDSLREAAVYLRQPFTDAAVKWKVQATWPSGDPHSGLVVPYIDARLVIERLNAVCPHLWFDQYEPVSGGRGLVCRLTVDGTTRIDVGSGYEGKGLFSDAFKRAGVKFGIGVSLYALPKIVLKKSDGFLETKEIYDKKSGGKKKTLALTDKGVERCMSGYRAWLRETGESAFGPALDHGDVFGSYGDTIDKEDQQPAGAPTPEEPAVLDDVKAKALIARAEDLQKTLPAKVLPKAQFTRELAGASASHEDLEKLVVRLEGLQP